MDALQHVKNYMYLQRYKYDEKRKDIYYDKYEKSDMIEYRKGWLKRMFIYKKYVKEFNNDILDVVLEPKLKLGEKKLVQVIYDECHFYANDR